MAFLKSGFGLFMFALKAGRIRYAAKPVIAKKQKGDVDGMRSHFKLQKARHRCAGRRKIPDRYRILYVLGAPKFGLRSPPASGHMRDVVSAGRENWMRASLKAALAIALAVLLFAADGSAFAQSADIAKTQHSIRIDGKTLKYTAEAGRLPIRDQATGEVHGEMFFTAYRVPSRTPRPVAFIWNGGPGANSVLLHFEAFGPRAFSDGVLSDNQATLLESADLVFVDPIGTGFSRPLKREYEAEFYNTLGDHQSVAEFIRVWRLRFGAQEAPVFLIGESFGTWRAAGVAEIMAKRGQHVAGIVLISGGAGVGPGYDTRPERASFRIPNRAATALHHSRLDKTVGADRETVMMAAEKWASEVYAPALARIIDLTDAEREKVARELARYTGIPESAVDRKTLEVTPRAYLALLLKDQGKTLNTFDMRIAGSGDEGVQSGRIYRYFRSDLSYATDLAYVGLGDGLGEAYSPTGAERRGINAQWNYNSGEITPEVMAAAQAGEGPPGSQPWAINAVRLDPKLKVMVAAGMYDSLNSCAQNNALMTKLERDVASSFSMKCYAGGHMMYRDRAEGVRLSADVKAFIAGAR
jgi:carboxypeptidase C (cathepsin A)